MELDRVHVVEDIKKIYTYPFERCTSKFDRPSRLAQHRLVHDNIKPFVCKELKCEKAYTSKSHLGRHIKTAHKEAAEVLYCCPKCMKKYANRQNLKRHMKISHSDNSKPFCCALCRLCFKKKHQLKAHMFDHNGLKSFRCPTCERVFITLNEKKKHMKNHKTYKCEHCETIFTKWTELMHHKRVEHVLPEYICHDCGKAFKGRGHIIRHVKKHMPNATVNMFFCPYDNCCRHYSRKSNLKQHISVKHEGLTFDCSLCRAKLTTKAKLNEHIDRHNRPQLPVKAPNTLKTGRKKRKDAGTIRCETALRLAGVVKQNMEDSIISRIYSEQLTNNIDKDTQVGNFKNKNRISLEKSTVLQHHVNIATKQSTVDIEVKLDCNSNESTKYVDKHKTMLKPPNDIRYNNVIRTLSSSQINKPACLIEILNRPTVRIDHSQE